MELIRFSFRICACCSILLLLPGTLISQGLAYTRTTFSAPYVSISEPAATLSLIADTNNAEHPGVPIGFNFEYNDTAYAAVTISTNGWIAFGKTSVQELYSHSNQYLYQPLANYPPTAVLAPYWDDLSVGPVGTNPAGKVLYQTQGLTPNRTFTVQWTEVSSYSSTTNGQPAILNFQVILYEGTNVIEFRYGNKLGTSNNSESASVGISNLAGNGPNNFIDALTGSKNIFNAQFNSSRWPVRHIRFTPGLPSPLPGGTYNVGAGQYYPSLSEAVADLNHRGISGPVVLKLTDTIYDGTIFNGRNYFPLLFGPVSGTSAVNTITIEPQTIAKIIDPGSASVSCGNVAMLSYFTATNEPVVAFIGTDHVTMKNIEITSNSSSIVDQGIHITNFNTIDGARHNTFDNISISLNKSNTNTQAVNVFHGASIISELAANSYNTFYNCKIDNTCSGYYFTGTGTYPLRGIEVGSRNGGRSEIGSSVSGSMGGANTSWGIRVANAVDARIFDNEIRNLTVTSTGAAYGIYLESDSLCEVYNNRIYNLRNSNTSISGRVYGISAHVLNSGDARIYNNMIYGLTSGYTGSNNATRQVYGIIINPSTYGTYHVDFNTVSIQNDASLTSSSTCVGMDNASTLAKVFFRNNIFCNMTGPQSGNAKHYVWDLPSSTIFGAEGSLSDHNVMYLDNTSNGFISRSGPYERPGLYEFQLSYGMDEHSLSLLPNFLGGLDTLHVRGLALKGKGTMEDITWVATDIDGQARAAVPDIGADEFTLDDVGLSGIEISKNGDCYGNNEDIIAIVENFKESPIDFTLSETPVFVVVSGATSQTFNFVLDDNDLNDGEPLLPGGQIRVPMGTLNMTSAGEYLVKGYTSASGELSGNNDTLETMVSVSAGEIIPTATLVCEDSRVELQVTGHSGPIEWQVYDNVAMNWTSYAPGGSDSLIAVYPSNDIRLRVRVCGLYLSDEVLITTIPKPPKPTIYSNGPIEFCEGGDVMLSSDIMTDIVWSPGGEEDQDIIVTESGKYTVTVTDGFGCQSAADTIEVKVIPVVPPVISASGPLSFCPGDSVVLTSSQATGISWSDGTTSPVLVVYTSGLYSVIDLVGCGGTSEEVEVIVFPDMPEPEITAGGPTTFCAGGSVMLTSSSSEGNRWTPSGDTLPNLSADTTGYYYVTVTDANGCSKISNGIQVTVNAPPVPEVIVSGPLTFCQGLSVVLTSASGDAVKWSPGGATTPSITVTQSGDYTATVTDDNGCSSTSEAVGVVVHPLPQVILAPFSPYCINYGPLGLTGGFPAGGYYSGMGVALDTLYPELAGLGTHKISYYYEDQNGCKNKSSQNITIDACTGIDQLTAPAVTVYPNPAVDKLILDLAPNTAPVKWLLYDMYGRIVKESPGEAPGSDLVIGLSGLSPGMYLLEVSIGSLFTTTRIQIRKEE